MANEIDGIPIIDDDPGSPAVAFDGRFSRGYSPRDYSKHPVSMFATPPAEMKLIPRSEWSARCKEQAEKKSRISDMRASGVNGGMMPCLDQNGFNYCWAHSTTHAVMLKRMFQGQPYVPLSAVGMAQIIMKGANDGGWCGLSAKFAREIGIPSQSAWPQKGYSNYKQHDTPALRADAAQFRIDEDWVDLSIAVYEEDLTFDQVATRLLLGDPCPVDFNWWGHSVCAMDLVEVEPGDFGLLILNSWWIGPNQMWGKDGTGILRGSKCRPDGALSIASVGVAA